MITATTGSTLDTIEVTDNGTTVYAVSPHTAGPSNADFATTLNLAVGPHTICATATGTDAGGSGSVTDCFDVSVVAAGTVIVDCGATSGTCTATAQDPGKSTLAFSAPPAFDKTVTIAPNAGTADACGGSTCRTGYDVLFPATGSASAIASISVVTAGRVSLLDRLQASVYLDGVRITAECSNRIIVKLIRDRYGIPEPIPCKTITYLKTGQLEYFVKFNADPAVRFR